MAAEQLAFDLGHRRALGRRDFLVSDCNRAAIAWIDRWPDWPAPGTGLAICGPEASGKSHLGAVWARRSGAVTVRADDLTGARIAAMAGGAGAVLVDGLSPSVDGTALLHLHNLLAQRGSQMLLLSRIPPARLGLTPADLASRLNALPVVAIRPPDQALLAALLEKLLAERQLAPAPGLAAFAVNRMERSFAAVQRLVATLDRKSLAEGRRVTLPLARAVLARWEQSGPG